MKRECAGLGTGTGCGPRTVTIAPCSAQFVREKGDHSAQHASLSPIPSRSLCASYLPKCTQGGIYTVHAPYYTHPGRHIPGCIPTYIHTQGGIYRVVASLHTQGGIYPGIASLHTQRGIYPVIHHLRVLGGIYRVIHHLRILRDSREPLCCY